MNSRWFLLGIIVGIAILFMRSEGSLIDSLAARCEQGDQTACDQLQATCAAGNGQACAALAAANGTLGTTVASTGGCGCGGSKTIAAITKLPSPGTINPGGTGFQFGL